MWFIAWSRDENIALLGYFVVADILEYVFNGIAVLPRYVIFIILYLNRLLIIIVIFVYNSYFVVY